ncbi:MAG: FecR domain-containing protein [Candidatus Omnitrophica bacterium]|nr:FecR domain-containing protein [Candidatus Omnitrophota bacterium]
MKILTFVVVLVMLVGLTLALDAAEVSRTGKLVDMQGDVMVKFASSEETLPAEIGMKISEGDMIMTKADSWVFINLDGVETATVEVEGNSKVLLAELVMDEEEGTQQTLLDLAIGKVLVTAQKIHHEDSSFQVKTPTSVVGVRGTTFAVEVEGLE